jgi:hypothetical protein
MMDHIPLIIRGKGVDDDVDPRFESFFSLTLSPRNAFIDPLPKSVPRPCPGQIVLGIYDRGPVIDRDAFEICIDLLATSEAVD